MKSLHILDHGSRRNIILKINRAVSHIAEFYNLKEYVKYHSIDIRDTIYTVFYIDMTQIMEERNVQPTSPFDNLYAFINKTHPHYFDLNILIDFLVGGLESHIKIRYFESVNDTLNMITTTQRSKK